MTDEGLVMIPSRHDVATTIDRLAVAAGAKGLTVFARIDHAAGAAGVGLPLRPTQLLLFGSPQAGTPLMQSSQAVGIDLPLKPLAWQDATGQVWLAYSNPVWVARRHELDAEADGPLAGMLRALQELAAAAASDEPRGSSG